MENLCKKFPKICNCPYKEDIDNDLQKGKSPYYIAKWLKDTECPISYETLRKYLKYLVEHGGIKQESQSPSEHEEELLTKLEQKAKKAIDNLDMDNLSDNVKVQFILGAYKILYGNTYKVDMAADVNTTTDQNIKVDDKVLGVLADAVQRRNHSSN